ncbi:hypothetical protein D9M71_241420 [compost metagenome]
MVEAERRTDGQYPLAHLELLGVTQFHRWQILAIDLQQRHVSTRVGTHQLGLELATVRQADDDLVGIGHHMVIGEHVAITGDDETRAQRLRLALAVAARRARLLGHVALEELAEHRRQAFQVRHLACGDSAVRQLLLGTDVDHRRRSLLHQGGEVRQGFLGLGGEDLAEHQHSSEHH